MTPLPVRVFSSSRFPLPQYATIGAAGLDLIANLDAPILLRPMERRMIPTGLYIEVPMGYEAQVRPRSGLALKQGITCLNSPGTVDSDYRGEIGVILINLSDAAVAIEPGMRIAQLVLAAYAQAAWVPVEDLNALSDSDRGAGGFGHTGH